MTSFWFEPLFSFKGRKKWWQSDFTDKKPSGPDWLDSVKFCFWITKHILTHSTEKPFKWDQCNYLCTVSSNLKVHKHTHTGEELDWSDGPSHRFVWPMLDKHWKPLGNDGWGTQKTIGKPSNTMVVNGGGSATWELSPHNPVFFWPRSLSLLFFQYFVSFLFRSLG